MGTRQTHSNEVACTFMDMHEFELRKRQHIEQALNPDNQAGGLSELERVHLFHDAIPEIDFEEVQIHSNYLGQVLKTPFFIAGMTAGHPGAFQINERLARASAKRGWILGIGSLRRELAFFQQTSKELSFWKKIRKSYPEVVLIANLGISELIGADLEHLLSLCENFSPQAFAIHLNSLQECIQWEQAPRLRGGIFALEKLARVLPVPLLIKETGCGFSEQALRKLTHLKLSALDVSGLGGTHWGRIEGVRAETGSVQFRAARTFRNWGESTVDSLVRARKILSKSTEIWASGGVRSGIDAAKLFALGATRVGYAQPALQAALLGQTELETWMDLQEFELKTALFCTGSINLKSLRKNSGKRGRKWQI